MIFVNIPPSYGDYPGQEHNSSAKSKKKTMIIGIVIGILLTALILLLIKFTYPRIFGVKSIQEDSSRNMLDKNRLTEQLVKERSSNLTQKILLEKKLQELQNQILKLENENDGLENENERLKKENEHLSNISKQEPCPEAAVPICPSVPPVETMEKP